MLDTIREWVNFETPTGDEARLNAFMDVLSREFSKTGAILERINLPGGDMLHATLGSGDKKAVMLGHADTVFECGKSEKFDTENSRLYGAGVSDMKTGLVMMLEVFKHFKQDPPVGWRLEALINSDEESGSSESKVHIIRLSEGAKLCLCFEASPEGFCTLKRKGITSYRLTVRGISKHTSRGDTEKRSAARAVVDILSRIYALENGINGLSVNVGMIKAEGRANIIAGKAEALIETRAYSAEALEIAKSAIHDICSNLDCNASVELKVMGERPPMNESDESLRVYEIAKKHAEREGLALKNEPRGGGSDGAFAAHAGVPVLDGIGAEGGRAHTRREYVIANTIEARTRVCIETIAEVMG